LLLMGAVLFLAFVGDRAGMKLLNGVPLAQLPSHLITPALIWSLALLMFVPGFLLAERAGISRGRAGPYTFVVLVGSALVTAVTFPLADWLGLAPPGSRPPPHFAIFLMILLRMGLAAFVYAGLRERLDAARTIQTLEARQNEMMGRLAASRLQATRARVQPEFFIAELRVIRTACHEAPAVAGAGLEALISRLRAASRGAAP